MTKTKTQKELIEEIEDEVCNSPYANGSLTAREISLINLATTLAIQKTKQQVSEVIDNRYKHGIYINNPEKFKKLIGVD